MSSVKEQVNFTDNLDFFARQVVDGFLTGLHKSPYHGFSVEFAEHRLYNQGDSIKNIDWKLFARSDRLFVKKYEEETNLRSHILIDTSSSMLYPFDSVNQLNKLSFSLYAAACLIHLFYKQRDGFGLTFYSDQLNFFSQAKSNKYHYNRLMGVLDKMLNKQYGKERKTTNFSATITDFIEKIPERSLVIIFSDMMNFDAQSNEHIFESFQHLRYKKNEVILFHVQDRDTEKMFEFSNHPYKFLDLESNETINMNPSQYREHYLDLYDKFTKEIGLNCNKYKIDYVPSFISDGFTQVLLSYLTKRSKLF